MEDGDTVFVVKNEETFEVRAVETGAQSDTESVIVKGLREGETVVTQGSFVLKSELLKSELGEE
jgi:membrane fusion protein, heavy metal efflux system